MPDGQACRRPLSQYANPDLRRQASTFASCVAKTAWKFMQREKRHRSSSSLGSADFGCLRYTSRGAPGGSEAAGVDELRDGVVRGQDLWELPLRLGDPHIYLVVGRLAARRQLRDGLERPADGNAYFDRAVAVVRHFAVVNDEHRARRSSVYVGLVGFSLHRARQSAGHRVDVHVTLFRQDNLLLHLSVFDVEPISLTTLPS
jgi:hypothetical protein